MLQKQGAVWVLPLILITLGIVFVALTVHMSVRTQPTSASKAGDTGDVVSTSTDGTLLGSTTSGTSRSTTSPEIEGETVKQPTSPIIQKDGDTTTTGTGYKNCPAGTAWECVEVTQGAEYNPDAPPPLVCGCMITSCPAGYHRIINGDWQAWPDGTTKGSSVCSNEWPPASAE